AAGTPRSLEEPSGVEGPACDDESTFFFSSRRRHTRLVSDWSSDVCSSDLVETSARGAKSKQRRSTVTSTSQGRRRAPVWPQRSRSEERRVGKEVRYRWSMYSLKKKKQ